MFLTPDKVVIADEHGSPVPELIEGGKFCHDLLRSLVTGLSSKEVHHIAKFAVKGASPGSLNRHAPVIVQPQQVEPGDRRSRQVGLSVGFDHPGVAISYGLQKQRNRMLSFAAHHEITSRLQG